MDILIGNIKKLSKLDDTYTKIASLIDVLIMEIGIKHEANVNTDNVLMGKIEVAYSTTKVAPIKIPLSAIFLDFINHSLLLRQSIKF